MRSLNMVGFSHFSDSPNWKLAKSLSLLNSIVSSVSGIGIVSVGLSSIIVVIESKTTTTSLFSLVAKKSFISAATGVKFVFHIFFHQNLFFRSKER